MRLLRPAIFLTTALILAACGSFGSSTRKEIEGNNTGGIIPAEMLRAGGNAQLLADAHCAKWKSTARITYGPTDANSDAVFVCEIGGAPALMAPAVQQPAPTKR
ncbi:MAG: hypothetical protein IT539_14315 [Bradyrhizobiaceae bacterium]|nr:hypothetical protein [Bradyrhizobiaceae bacterium]